MELEFLICQYLDGALDAEAREDLESRLALDAGARSLLAEHRRLNDLLVTDASASARVLATIDYDALDARISGALDQATQVASVAEQRDVTPSRTFGARLARRAADAYRIFSISELGSGARTGVALAASLLLAVGIFFHFHGKQQPVMPTVAEAPATPVVVVAQVSGPQAESAPNGVAEVSIGPGKLMGNSPLAVEEGDDLVARPSHVVIASGINPDQDGAGLPY